MASRTKKLPLSKVGEIAAKAPKQSGRCAAAFRLRALRDSKTIEAATGIVPRWVAERVLNEAAAWLNTDLLRSGPTGSDARAERLFAKHGQFHRLISSNANGGTRAATSSTNSCATG